MSTIINGTSSAITFPDTTVQNTSAIVGGYVPYANLPAGSVLQVVNATGTAALSTASATPVSAGFSATITPKFATSKVLVQFYGRCYVPSAGVEGSVYIYRGGSSIQGGYTVYSSAGGIASQQSVIVLDAPATTSATTYSIYFKTSSTGISINPNSTTDGAYGLLLTEIAG